jgi:hypothetical protein
MLRAQQNYKIIVLVAGLFLAAGSAFGGTISRSTGPDPILTGGPSGPCDPRAEGPDFVPGTDINGNPVVPATVGAKPVPVPQALLVPVGHGRNAPQAVLSGKQIAALIDNPPCPKRH